MEIGKTAESAINAYGGADVWKNNKLGYLLLATN